jgi:hypothetical protein
MAPRSPSKKTKKTTKKKKKTLSGKKMTADEMAKAWRAEDMENREALEFIQAIDRFKRKTQRAFPSWSEVLKILKTLGYRKV